MEEIIFLLIKRFIFLIFICMLEISYSHAADALIPKTAILKKISWSSNVAKKRFHTYFKDLMEQPYDELNFKIQLDQISKELFNNGYFSVQIKSNAVLAAGNVEVLVAIDLKDRINFNFQGNKIFTYQELKSRILDKVKNEFGKTDVQGIADYIKSQYETEGIYQTGITYYQNEGLDLEKLPVVNYFFVIDEGRKISIKEILYRGNSNMSLEHIRKLSHANASSLVKSNFYDKKYFDEFTDVLKKEYLSRGFVFVEVSKPRVVNSEDNKSVSIEYGITEKQQVILKKISFGKIPENLAIEARKKLINKDGFPVNIVELESDLRKMITFFQTEGYYFATISNLTSENLLVYDKSYAFVELSPEISLDRKVCYGSAIINGNIKTDSSVIFREIEITPGELITPDKLENIRQRLSGLNLFSSLKITPYMLYEPDNLDCQKTNLVIQVKEKDFGLLEVAPGFRTDIGAKLSTGVVYNNIFGMNRSASLKLQSNRRFNLDGFDNRRKLENKDLLEYSVRASFVEPYLFHDYIKTQIEFELSSTFQRVRYYGFDADVFRFSPQFSKTFTQMRWLSTSLKYQFERIVQFDATASRDNDNFSIGGVTPSVTLDFRDDPLNPRKGSYFTLSSEWANSNFGSMKESDLEVNFVKVISRNRFYYPVGDFTLALSIAGGYQKNFSETILKDSNGNQILNANGEARTRGYIPSIKVFRLDGYDEIRGYNDTEINRLIDGREIGDVVVQRNAYFTSVKFEPRYNLTDNLQLGVFLDGGRLFIGNFQPFKLRTSAGLGLKYLTPVGSLDFDYGFKLQRRTYSGDIRDTGGRFHLSIGFF
jgi:outer membrane protein insertion porin family